jgi:hypothetical protein
MAADFPSLQILEEKFQVYEERIHRCQTFFFIKDAVANKLERFLLFSLFEDREISKYKDIEYKGHIQKILASQGQTL